MDDFTTSLRMLIKLHTSRIVYVVAAVVLRADIFYNSVNHTVTLAFANSREGSAADGEKLNYSQMCREGE